MNFDDWRAKVGAVLLTAAFIFPILEINLIFSFISMFVGNYFLTLVLGAKFRRTVRRITIALLVFAGLIAVMASVYNPVAVISYANIVLDEKKLLPETNNLKWLFSYYNREERTKIKSVWEKNEGMMGEELDKIAAETLEAAEKKKELWGNSYEEEVQFHINVIRWERKKGNIMYFRDLLFISFLNLPRDIIRTPKRVQLILAETSYEKMGAGLLGKLGIMAFAQLMLMIFIDKCAPTEERRKFLSELRVIPAVFISFFALGVAPPAMAWVILQVFSLLPRIMFISVAFE